MIITVDAAEPQPKFPKLPASLKGLVNYTCKLETNASGGPSLYLAILNGLNVSN